MRSRILHAIPVIVVLLPLSAAAQIVTDGTVGPRATLSGPAMTIGAELGQTRGSNLFHSFQDFNIRAGESATFTGPSQIANVIGRVTGGNASNIDGTLRSTVGQADVYLVNPFGVVMGPSARVDVPAALHVSTADELRFQDGSRFSARDPASSTLTVAAPQSFGFLAPQPAGLTIMGSQLAVRPGKTLSLTAGDVRIAGSDAQRASLNAPGGTLRVEAPGATGGAVPAGAPAATAGSGTLTIEQADLDTSGDGGGLIALRAGTAILHDGWLSAANLSMTDAQGGIDARVSDRLLLNDGFMRADTSGGGRAGTVTVRAGSLRMENLSLIASDSYPMDSTLSLDEIGDAGSVNVEVVGRIEMLGIAEIGSSTWTAGDAGSVRIQADRLNMQDGARIINESYDAPVDASFTGTPTIAIEIAGLLEMRDEAEIGSHGWTAWNAAPGRAVTIRAGDLRMDGARISIESEQPEGSVGDTLTLDIAGQLDMLNGARISAATWGEENGGAIMVRAGAARLDGGDVDFTDFTGIDSSTSWTGNAGAVTVEIAGPLEMIHGGEIISNTESAGDAGAVTVRAGTARLDLSVIQSDAELGATGDAGDVTVEIAGLLELIDGGEISSNTWSTGNAGNVSVRAGAARLYGSADNVLTNWTGINSEARGFYEEGVSLGAAGNVTVEIDGLLEILNGAWISATSEGAMNAGTVRVRAGEARLDGGEDYWLETGIMSNAGSLWLQSAGSGGAVTVEVDGLLDVLNGAQIATDTWGLGNAGTVTVRAGSARLKDDGTISSTARADSAGNAGEVILEIEDQLEVLSGAEIVSSTSAVGKAGTVTIQAGRMLLDGGEVIGTKIASSANLGSTGDAGKVILQIAGLLDVRNNGQILSTTFASGDAGRVEIHAGAARMDAGGDTEWLTGVASSAESGSTGDGGEVILEIAGLLEMLDGAVIRSSTFAEGDAGTVSLHAGAARLDRATAAHTGIASNASADSTGLAGVVMLEINGLLEIRNGAEISTLSRQTLPDSAAVTREAHVQIAAGTLRLDGGIVSAASTGNVPAGNVEVRVGDAMLEHGSSIMTSAEYTSAGSIALNGGLLSLHDSLITTSAHGATGDGGDIVLAPKQLILDGGFVQANTAASGARGGDIRIDSAVLIASQGQVAIGGAERQSFVSGRGANVIQAAAPGGEQGRITVTAPAFDITASLTPLRAPFADPDDLLADACRAAGGARPSRLIEGMAGTPGASAAGIPWDAARLRRLSVQ